jgi:hypothetical protein
MPLRLAELEESGDRSGGDVGQQCRGAGGGAGFGPCHFPGGVMGAVSIALFLIECCFQIEPRPVESLVIFKRREDWIGGSGAGFFLVCVGSLVMTGGLVSSRRRPKRREEGQGRSASAINISVIAAASATRPINRSMVRSSGPGRSHSSASIKEGDASGWGMPEALRELISCIRVLKLVR